MYNVLYMYMYNVLYIHVYGVGCPQDYERSILWNETESGDVASIPCASAGSLFGTVSMITRSCSTLGVWEPADFSQCSINEVGTDFASIWITFEEDDVDVIRDNTSELINQVNDS